MSLLPLAKASLVLWLAGPSCQWEATDDDSDTTAQATLVGLGIGPNDPQVTVGSTLQFTATGFYSDQSTRDVTSAVEWQTSDGSVIEVGSGLDREGLGTAHAPGEAGVRATHFGLQSNILAVRVTAAQVTALSLAPSHTYLHPGEDTALVAEATFSDGSRGNVSGSVRWLTSDGQVATVDAGGVVQGVAQGLASVVAQQDVVGGVVESPPALVEVVGSDIVIDDADVRIVGLNHVEGPEGVTWTVSVRNSGGAPATGFWVDLWLHRTAAPPLPPATGDVFAFVDVLEPDATIDVPLVLEGAAPGSYQSWALVDSYNTVPEGQAGENNNGWGPHSTAVTGDGGPVGAELAISYLQAFVDAADDSVLYIVDVTNTGGEAAIDFRVGIFADPSFPPEAPATPDEVATIELLAPGQTMVLDLAVRGVPESWWVSYALADCAADVTENNEANNVAYVTVEP